MDNFIISCCSTADLTKEHLTGRGIHYICFHYELDGKQYRDDLGETMSAEEFYNAMVQGAETKTSQINEAEFEEYFEPFLQQGKDILHLCLSSGITGVANSANLAREALLERYPDRKIYIIDTLAASSGLGMLVDKVADLRDEGWNMDELAAWIEANKCKLHHWFFTSDLTFFVKGGRVTKTAGFVGGILNICPLLNVNSEGKLIPRYKIRTKKKAIQAIVEQMEKHAQNGTAYDGKCYMCHSVCYEDAKAVAELVESRFPNLDGKVLINNIGTTIGSHTGPGTVALFFWGDEREV